MKGQAGRLVEAIKLVFVGRIGAQVRVALLDDHVAGGASAASSTGVFDMHAEVDGDI